MNTFGQRDDIRFNAGAAFRVQGIDVDLDMESITQQLGRAPTLTHRRGDTTRAGRTFASDIWLFESPLGGGQDLEEHLKGLMPILLPHKEFISELRERFKVDIYCYKTPYTEQSSITLSPKTLKLFTELSLDFCVSLIFILDEPETDARSDSLSSASA
jgi:hypothetical protein